jgi:hypothetical protein
MTDFLETYEKYMSVCKVNKKEISELIVFTFENEFKEDLKKK